MKTLAIPFLISILLISVMAPCQTKMSQKDNPALTVLKQRRKTIDEYIFKHQKDIIEFAKVSGKKKSCTD